MSSSEIEPGDSDFEDQASLTWVRKRDGSVVAFDAAKLASSIYAARRAVEPENAAFTSQELTQAVVHFLNQDADANIPSTAEICETVVKVLREMGQAPTAIAYFEFQARRQELREKIRVVDPKAKGDELPTSKPKASSSQSATDSPPWSLGSWDKAKLVQFLQIEMELEPATAREVAASVERMLLAWQKKSIPASLVLELVQAELDERGLRRMGDRRRTLGVNAMEVEQWLSATANPNGLPQWAGRQVLRQYALREVYSRDIAALHEEGLIRIFGLASPGHWSAVNVDMLSIGTRCNSAESFLKELRTELDRVADRVDGLVALECFDSVAAIVASQATDASAFATEVCHVLTSAVRGRNILLDINLHGSVPDSVAEWMSEGPLFAVRTNELHDRFASQFAARLTENIFSDTSLSQACRIEYHCDPAAMDEDVSLGLRPWAKWACRSGNVRFCFDRDKMFACEGITIPPASRSAVYGFVGLNLDALLDRLGDSRDDETMFERLGLLCESSVHAAVQKREFLRRRQPEFFAGRDHSRAAFAVVPIGLESMVLRMIGKPVEEDPAALAFGKQILAAIAQRVRKACRHFQMQYVIETAPWDPSTEDSLQTVQQSPGMAIPQENWRAAFAARGSLYTAAAGGTVFVPATPEWRADPERITEAILFAGAQTQMKRIGFLPIETSRQPVLDRNWVNTKDVSE